jgi:hypothetical protein
VDHEGCVSVVPGNSTFLPFGGKGSSFAGGLLRDARRLAERISGFEFDRSRRGRRRCIVRSLDASWLLP